MVRCLLPIAFLAAAAASLDAQSPPPAPAGGDAPTALAHALAAPAPDSATLAVAMEALDDAARALGDEAFEAAAGHYGRVAELLPTLSDWVPLFQAEALAETGDTASVRSLISSLDVGAPARVRWSWMPTARALEVAGEPGAALSAAREGTELARSDGERARAWLRVGELSLEAGSEAEARAALLRAMTADRRSRHAGAAADAMAGLDELTALERYRMARVRLAQGRWKDAIGGLEAAGDADGLDGEERQQARLDLTRALFETRRYATAGDNARSLAADTTASEPVAARALYWLGRSLYRQGHRSDGRATLESVADLYPQQRAAREALYILADLDHDAGRNADAGRYYRRIMDIAATSTTADVAGMRLGGMLYLDGDYAAAARVFDRRGSEAGRSSSRQQATYWSGLAYASMDRPDSALHRFRLAYEADPLTYYGAQSAMRVDAPLLTDDLPPGPETPDAASLAGPLANAVARLRVHARVPTPGSFEFELARLKEHFGAAPGGDYALAEALIHGGLPIQGIVAGREIQRRSDGWNLRLLRVVYPFPYRDVIVREASLRDVNPYFAAGLIRQESMFDEDIKSRAGAIGMMQVMPATGRELARGEGVRPFSAARLTEAEVNVQLGMTFLADMLRRYDGEVLDALVAYNAGPTRIRRWRGMPEYGDADVFTERIPFSETRHYVKVVQQNALIYQTLYGCGDEPCLGSTPSRVRGLMASDTQASALR